VRLKPLHLIGLMTLAFAHMYGQPTNGPVYWSTTQPDCSSINNETPLPITDSTGATIGYSCYVAGTFVWLAAGGGWGTSIRVAAPASAPIGVDYSFFTPAGNQLSLDTSGSYTQSASEVSFALSANQPAQLNLLGTTGKKNSTGSYPLATGSVYAVFLCPDAATCSNVLPQLIYSALPSQPWSLSVPIAWDSQVWTQWSAEGVDDGTPEHRVSLVIYNASTAATTYTVDVYNSAGSLVGSAQTPSIPGQANAEGGTYGVLLSSLIKTPLPSGIFKVLVDGGTANSAVEMLQINGPSATTLQVAFDSAPNAAAAAAAVQRSGVGRSRAEAIPRRVFPGLPE